jgi:hypothetical protein
MKGLKNYIKKHGKHFTEELAYSISPCLRWNKEQIEDTIQKKVWYNTTSSTIGDIVYLVNNCYEGAAKSKCINYALLYIGDFRNYENPFEDWLTEISNCGTLKDCFDFTPYI